MQRRGPQLAGPPRLVASPGVALLASRGRGAVVVVVVVVVWLCETLTENKEDGLVEIGQLGAVASASA